MKRTMIVIICFIIAYRGFEITVEHLRKHDVENYLLELGYEPHEFEVNADYSLLNKVLSYHEYVLRVTFSDEPNVTYYFGYKEGQIFSNGVAGNQNRKIFPEE